MKKNILYVDDERENLIVFRAAFAKHFNVIEASCAAEALDLLSHHDIPVLVADQRMPDMTGVELCEAVEKLYPHTIRMILTGYIDSDAMMDAINKGHVYNFIAKPWNRGTLLSILLRACEAYELAVSNSALLERVNHTDRCATLGRVAAGVAHEIRNQLFILPLVELLEVKYAHDEELMQLASAARDTHNRLNELITEVMDFVRKDETPREAKVVNLADVVQETVSLACMDDSISRDRLDVDVNVAPYVRCHKTKIQQVMFNLIKNASDAITEKSNGRIGVRLDVQNARALLSISDNGQGIDPEILERIWEPFFTTKGENGNGFGLDMCRRIIASHNGTISCESTPGRGAKFTVDLPIDQEQKLAPTGTDIPGGTETNPCPVGPG